MNTVDQRLGFLELANAVRVRRAQLRIQAGAGEISTVGLLEDPPSCIERLEIVKLLMWMPQVGRGRAMMLLRKSGVPSHLRVDQLTARQIEAIVPVMRDAELRPGLGTRPR